MRPCRRFLLATCLALAVAHGARAALTDSFDSLRSELTIREAGLQGSTDPRALLQVESIRLCYAAIDRSATLSGDCRAAGRIATLLNRAFPSEFVARDTFAADLSDFVGDAFQQVVNQVCLARESLEARALGLRPRTAFLVRRAIDACDLQLDRALRATNWADQARLLAAAAGALERGTRIADADTIK